MAIVDRFLLVQANRARLGVDIASAIDSVELSGSMEAMPSVTVQVNDPGSRLIESGNLIEPTVRDIGTPAGWKIRPVDVELDGIFYRLARANPSQDTLTLTFDHRFAVYMQGTKGAITARRSSVTRAQWERRQVVETARRKAAPYLLPFWAPELRRRMPVARPDESLDANVEVDRDVIDAITAGSSGLKGVTVKGVKADAEQRNNISISLAQAEADSANEKATVGLICLGIAESAMRNVRNSQGSKYSGVYQADPANIPPDDTRQMAHYALVGGKGYHFGGMIGAARQKGWSVGEMCWRVGGSVSNFASEAAATQYYGQFEREARQIVAAGRGEGISAGSLTGGYASGGGFLFKRAADEDAWANTGDVAQEVNKRRFITIPWQGQDVFVYASDADLLKYLESRAVIDLDAGYVGDWDYEVDHGQSAQTATLELDLAKFGSLPWGFPVTIRNAGTATGDWLVWDVTETQGEFAQVNLRQPEAIELEPRGNGTALVRTDVTDNSAAFKGGGVDAVVARAKQISDQNLPYAWGGGHPKVGEPSASTRPGESQVGYDCSGYVAACLDAAGFLPGTWKNGVPDSGTFANDWGVAGEGSQMTVWANGGHIFIEFESRQVRWADTSTQAGGPDGPHVRFGERSTAGFTARCWPGT